MGKKEKAIDNYIHNAADFAKPILNHLRELVHKTCPEAEEKMKWSFPHFDFKNEMMCSMAAFKQHAVFGFWKASLMKNPILVENAKSEVAMGHLGRLTSKQDLPSDKIIIGWIKEAMHLNDLGIKLPAKIKAPAQKELLVPADFLALLDKNKKARQTFEAFAYGKKKEYIIWINEAKTEDTRNKRITTSIEWLAEGKTRNWKYATK
jgi:uncharacterized protein YdeI (YjbR/CyaY-like superfamily)